MSDTSDRPVSSNGNGESEIADEEVIATTGNQARRSSFGPGGGLGMPVEQSRDFRATIGRLGEILGRERGLLVVVILFTVGQVMLVAFGPRLLGQATDVVVDGVTSGDGIDFGDLRNRLLFIAGLYIAAWFLHFSQGFVLAGIVQRSMYRLRESVERKIKPASR